MKVDKAQKKEMLYYILLPVIATAYLLLQMSRLEPEYILRFEALIVFGYIISVEDMKNKRIPNVLVLLMLAAWGLISLPRFFVNMEKGLEALVASVLGAALAFGVFLSVYILSKKGLGGGDVKFMAVAGLYLGIGGVMPAMLIGTILAAAVGLLLLAFKCINQKDSIPLAPFLYAGILVTIFLI